MRDSFTECLHWLAEQKWLQKSVRTFLVVAQGLGSLVSTGDKRDVMFAFATLSLSVPYGDRSFAPGSSRRLFSSRSYIDARNRLVTAFVAVKRRQADHQAEFDKWHQGSAGASCVSWVGSEDNCGNMGGQTSGGLLAQAQRSPPPRNVRLTIDCSVTVQAKQTHGVPAQHFFFIV